MDNVPILEVPHGITKDQKDSKEYKKWRLVLISDTHNLHPFLNIPEGDILIHAGDFVKRSKDKSLYKDFNKWLGKQNFKHRIVIAGNHEYLFNRYSKERIDRLLSNCKYLQDTYIEIEGLKIYGTPWQSSHNMAFSCNKANLSEKWAMIPEGLDILITHMPPHAVMDLASNGRNWGCKALKQRVLEEIKPNLHVFGHVHEGYGFQVINNVTLVNAASERWPIHDENDLVRKPIVVDYYQFIGTKENKSK
jgi:Icc-related predicted phosphoesterase